MMKGINFVEMTKLDAMLTMRNIPHDFTYSSDVYGYELCYPNTDNCVCRVTLNRNSIGHEDDFIELDGLLTDEEKTFGDTVGYLIADDVFPRIKSDWENRILD